MKRRLPYLPLHYFIHHFSGAEKRMFWALFALLILLAGLFLFSASDPDHWVLTPVEVPSVQAEELAVRNLTRAYRSYSVELTGYAQEISYAARPLDPPKTPIWIFLLLQALIWPLALALTPRIRRWEALGIGAAFLLYLHLSSRNILAAAYPGAESILLEVGIVLAFLFPGILFYLGRIRISYALRSAVFLLLSALWHLFLLHQNTWENSHRMMMDSFVLMAVISILFLFFISKEPTNAIFALATNRKDIAKRWSYRWVIIAVTALLLIELLLMDKWAGWKLLDLDIGLRPAHLIFFSVLIYLFTSQNHFIQVKKAFREVSTFTLLMLLFGLLSMSFLWAQFSFGDRVFILVIERIAIIFFLGLGFSHLIYAILNHGYLFREKAPLYFYLPKMTHFNFGLVWLTAMVFFSSMEMMDRWRSPGLLFHAYANHMGDRYRMSGDLENAERVYRQAGKLSQYSVKSNFNQAAVLMADPKNLDAAVEALKKAGKFWEFPFARINAANLLRAGGREAEGLDILRRGEAHHPPNVFLKNNLALFYQRSEDPDSAILMLKAALLRDPGFSGAYSNLARIYEAHDRPGEARRFHELALDCETVSPAAYANALLFGLKESKVIATELKPEDFEQDYFLYTNAALWELHEKNPDRAAQLLGHIPADRSEAERVLIESWILFAQDSILNSVSRLNAISSFSPESRARGFYNLGVGYWYRDVPEMAESFFEAAGDLGIAEGSLAAAQMSIDLGELDSAALQLMLLRGRAPKLFEACSRELGMLLTAYGQEIFANTEWPLDQLSSEQWILVGRYADSLASFGYALNAFRHAQELDSSSAAPYLELGSLYNRYGDGLAIPNLEYGLANTDEMDLDLRRELARAYLIQGQDDKARGLVDTLLAGAPDDPALIGLHALMQLQSGDTAAAEVGYLSLVERDPLNTEAILGLAAIYDARQEIGKGSAILQKALDLNDRNGRLWYAYARVVRNYAMDEEAAYSARMALNFIHDPVAKARISAEFAPLLKAYDF